MGNGNTQIDQRNTEDKNFMGEYSYKKGTEGGGRH